MEITKLTNCKNKYFRATWVELDKDGEVNTEGRFYDYDQKVNCVLFEIADIDLDDPGNIDEFFLPILQDKLGIDVNAEVKIIEYEETLNIVRNTGRVRYRKETNSEYRRKTLLQVASAL